MHFSSVEDDQFPGGFVFKTVIILLKNLYDVL